MLFVVAMDVLNEFNERPTEWDTVLLLSPEKKAPSGRWKAQPPPNGSGKWKANCKKENINQR